MTDHLVDRDCALLDGHCACHTLGDCRHGDRIERIEKLAQAKLDTAFEAYWMKEGIKLYMPSKISARKIFSAGWLVRVDKLGRTL